MKIQKIKGQIAVDLSAENIEFDNVEALVDYLGEYRFELKSEIFIINSQMITSSQKPLTVELCTQLRTKCRNYNCIVIVVGDYSTVDTELADYIYSCNNGKHLFLVNSVDEGIVLLKGVI